MSISLLSTWRCSPLGVNAQQIQLLHRLPGDAYVSNKIYVVSVSQSCSAVTLHWLISRREVEGCMIKVAQMVARFGGAYEESVKREQPRWNVPFVWAEDNRHLQYRDMVQAYRRGRPAVSIQTCEEL